MPPGATERAWRERRREQIETARRNGVRVEERDGRKFTVVTLEPVEHLRRSQHGTGVDDALAGRVAGFGDDE